MPFYNLANAQMIEVAVSGPGDVTRLYICKGLANGNTGVSVNPGGSQTITETWQFEVGPTIPATQFRRAIATVGFAGISEADPSPGGRAGWAVQNVFADYDDDAGQVRVSVTNVLSVANTSNANYEYAGVATLGYDVSILAAVAAG
jgi:hypothetical protein